MTSHETQGGGARLLPIVAFLMLAACGTTPFGGARSAATPAEPSISATATHTQPADQASAQPATNSADGTQASPPSADTASSSPSASETTQLTSAVGAATGTQTTDDERPTTDDNSTQRDSTSDDQDRGNRDGNRRDGRDGDDDDDDGRDRDQDGDRGGRDAEDDSPDELPGERIIGFGPRAGRELGVFGVRHDEGLAVRVHPGHDEPAVTKLEPLTAGVLATGHSRRLDDRSIWHEIQTSGETGWVPTGTLFYLGSTVDLTSYVVRRNGRYPTADTIGDLADLVADVLTDSPSAQLTTVVPPSTGPTAEITVDLGNLGHRSIWGWRLRVTAVESESGDGYTLDQVDATDYCLRGVSRSGRCT